MKNGIIHLQKITLLLILLTTAAIAVSAQTLNDDGSTHTINANGSNLYQGSAQDFTIPANSSYNSISFTLRGGDGGYAKAGADCQSNGGAGATVTAAFWIGPGTNDLNPGGTIRFIVGKRGTDTSVGGTSSCRGGGGGGSAVTYRPPNSSNWYILAVAGAGGGAYQGNIFGGCVDSQKGQGGQITRWGGNGEGSGAGAGGDHGQGGAQGDSGKGGGGNITAGGGDGGGAGHPAGGEGSNPPSPGNPGGWGFGGGGGGGEGGSGGAPGGGGYSGGGGGGVADNGGGGGSYVNPSRSFSSSRTEGGKGEGNSQNGYINYSFINTVLVWTGAVDHDWHNGGNWSPARVPGSNDLVEINAAANDPYIWNTADAKSVKVFSGGELTIQSNATLNLSPTNGFSGIFNFGTITNDNGILNISSSGNSTVDGILNSGNTFTNKSGGIINIEGMNRHGIANLSNGTFTNQAGGTINIGTESGQIGSSGVYNDQDCLFSNSGLLNIRNTNSQGIYNSGTFYNNPSGNILIDEIAIGGIVNISNGASFENSGIITIGSIETVQLDGIYNTNIFNNLSSGTIIVENAGQAGIFSHNGTFTNEGLIKIGENGNITLYAIFNGQDNSPVFLNSGCHAVIQTFDKSIRDDSNGFTNTGTIIQEAAESSNIHTNNSSILYNAGSFTVDNGNAPISVSGSFSGKKIWTGCDGNAWETPVNWVPVGTPTTSDEVFIYPTGTDPDIGSPAVAKSVRVTNGGHLFNNASLTVTDGDLDIDSGATVEGNGQYHLSGHFMVNGGTFIPDNSTVTMTGTVDERAIGFDPITFHNLIIDKPSDISVRIFANVSVTNEIIINSGDLEVVGVLSGSLTCPYLHLPTGTDLSNFGGNITVLDGSFWIQPGATAQGNGDYYLGGDFQLEGGTFTPGTSTVTFNGIPTQGILSDPVSFYNLTIDKPSGNVFLDADFSVSNELEMLNGNVDLNGADIELTGNGAITGEGPASYIYSTYGGVVKKTLDLNAPTAINPGNIGATITSSANLGSTTIQRGHDVQDVNGEVSILRYYDIAPSNNSGLDATLRFAYFDHELNGNMESDLLPQRFNGTAWDIYPVSTSDASANWVETENVDAFSKWTLAPVCEEFTFYADADGDGYGDPLVTVMDCTAPTGYVTDNTDCNDGDADEFPGQTWYEDADNDGYTTGNTETACERPTGYKLADELVNTTDIDCNDMNDAIHPGATESCNGIDDNCNSQTDEGVQSTFYADTDGDGYGDPLVTVMDCAAPTGYVTDNTDCNDGDADEFPGQTWYEDADNDGYTTGNTETACERPTGYKLADELVNTTDIDCNDMNDAVHPGATESCNGIDDNCNNQADEGIQSTYYADTDGDGYGDPLVTVMDCEAPTGYVKDNTDCNDGDADEFPGQTWYEDADNDGYTTGNTETACERPTGYKLADELVNTTDIDCNDMNDAIHPGASESCNGIDDNCNSQTDEGVQSTFYADSDGDGYGDPLVTVMDCAAPAGYVTDNTDCNDGDADEFPGQIWYIDMDGDGHGGSSLMSCERPDKGFLLSELMGNGTDDCADNNAFINPSAIEICDGLDNDCDGFIDTADDDLASTWAYSDVSNIAGAAGSAIFDPCEIGDGEVTLSFYSPSQNTAVDNHGYLHTELCGDGEVSFKVESTSNNAYVGLTMRASLDPAAKQASLFSNLTNMLRWETRYTDGAPVQVNAFYKPNPYWIKLKRQGDWIFGYYSAMGYNWSIVHAVYVPMNECIEAGISIWPFSPGTTETATVSNVYFTEYGGTNSEPELPEVEVAETNTRWSLYPNPARQKVNLVFEEPLESEVVVILRNPLGQVVEQRELRPEDQFTTWEVSSLTDGLYYMEIRTKGQDVQVLPFVKTQ